MVELALGRGERDRRAQRQRLLAPLGSSRSTATIGSAPASTRPSTIACPTPPQPTTTALSPARTPAVFSTAPTPVATEQPISAATSGGTRRVDRHDRRLRDDGRLGERPEPEEGVHAVDAPKGAPARACPVHSHARPDAHCTQRRQGANQDSTTLSPTATSRTSGPIASTTPGALVTEHERQRDRPVAVERVQVGVADAAGGQPHADLVADRVRSAATPQRPTLRGPAPS